jgi:integrase
LKEQQAARAQKQAERAIVPTIARNAIETYTKIVIARPVPKPSSKTQHLYYLNKAIDLLEARDLPLADIGVSAIAIRFETLQGSGSQRRHLYIALRKFLDWCRRRALIPANPCAALDRGDRPAPGKSREHTPTLTTVHAIWDAVDHERSDVRDLMRLLILMPLRRKEASGLRWGEVDLPGAKITIGAARMKNGAPHTLPLSAAAFELLQARRPAIINPDALVFPFDGKPYSGWHLLLVRIRKRIGEGEADRASRFAPHDLRRSFVSILAEHEFDPDLLDLCLAHSRARRGVFAAYQRSTRMGERKAAVEKWAELVLDTPATGNVVSIHAAR